MKPYCYSIQLVLLRRNEEDPRRPPKVIDETVLIKEVDEPTPVDPDAEAYFGSLWAAIEEIDEDSDPIVVHLEPERYYPCDDDPTEDDGLGEGSFYRSMVERWKAEGFREIELEG